MQIKDNYLIHKSSLWIALKVLVAAFAIYFIYQRFQAQEIELNAIVWPDRFLSLFALLVIMMLLNWSLEAWRWKISIQVFEAISFLESLKVVLGGLALNWVLPFTSGDALYRLSHMNDKFRTTSAVLLNRSLMLSITLVYGLVSLYYYSTSLVGLRITPVLCVLILAPVAWMLLKRKGKFLDYFRELDRDVIVKIVAVSLLRYVIFTLQLYLLLSLFLPHIAPVVLLLGVGWIFFFRSLIPSFFGGIGVREASGLIFFADADPLVIVVPIFLLWMLNSVVPSFIGLGFFLTSRGGGKDD